MPKIFSAANAALRALPARTIVHALADAAERWSDADFPLRVRASAAIGARLGYTLPVIDYALDRLFGGITAARSPRLPSTNSDRSRRSTGSSNATGGRRHGRAASTR
jgi:hypothetical protein